MCLRGKGSCKTIVPSGGGIRSLDILSTANRLHWDPWAYYRLIKY